MKISNDYGYMPKYSRTPAFKRNWSEHVSWGANYIKDAKKTDFKIFAFPDSKKVFVEIAAKAGAAFGGIKERIAQVLMAQGSALTLTTVMSKDEESTVYPMENKGDGVFEAKGLEAEPGSAYRFIVAKTDTDIRLVKDPYSKKQPDINGWSEIYDQTTYEWKNTDWLEGKDSRRIIRKPGERLRGLENLVIEEVNIPTLSKEGTFDAAKKQVDKIAEKGFATAIEIMPVENTFSLQWGYDGVDKFAVNEKLGGADKLKEFVDYAHGKGLNVIMDMVPNHIGPDGNSLPETGPYTKCAGKFGDIPNYEGKHNRYVRDWMANAALWWANEFKVDGIRFDLTKECQSDWLLLQMAEELNEHNPNVFLIAEDGMQNRESITRYSGWNASHDDKMKDIDSSVDEITTGRWKVPGCMGFDSEWDFNFMHEVKDDIFKPAAINIDRLDSNIRNSAHRVKFVMSHDEIGNLDGTRLIPKVMASELNLADKVDGKDEAQRGQAAAALSQKLAELCMTSDDILNVSMEDLHRHAKDFGLSNTRHLNPKHIEQAFNIAKAKQKLAMGTMMTIPGPKLYFQGDDRLELSLFKFFREFSSDKADRAKDASIKAGIIAKKGYDTLEEIARPDCIVGSVKPTSTKYQDEMSKFSADLAQVVKSSPALIKGDIVKTYKDNNNKVHIHQLKSGDDEVLVVKNFGCHFHNKNYGFYNFPSGNWKEIFNSDKKEYGGSDYINTSEEPISASNQTISLAPNSVVIYKKV